MGNDNSVSSMFAKQQAVSALNTASYTYSAQLQQGKESAPKCHKERKVLGKGVKTRDVSLQNQVEDYSAFV